MNRLNLANGLWINTLPSYQDVINFVVDKIEDEKSHFFNFLYFSNFVLQEKLESYHKALLNSDYILLDGIGMILYVKLIYKQKKILNLNGTDLLPQILDKLDKNYRGTYIALYGSAIDVIRNTYDILKNRYRQLEFYYYQDGYQPLDYAKLEEGSTLLVGLGTPKQENFVFENREIFRNKNITVITVGGLFDFISGHTKRAPGWIRTIRIEWAYRTLQEPKKHYQKTIRNLLFLYIIFRDYCKGS